MTQAKNYESNCGHSGATTIRHEIFEGYMALQIVNSNLKLNPIRNVYNSVHIDASTMDPRHSNPSGKAYLQNDVYTKSLMV